MPIVGEIDFDCDEMSALSLPPEFAVYEKVCHEEILLQEKACETKVRYGRKDVLRDENGNRMEECEKEKTDEELVAGNEHQEVYDPVIREIDFRKLVPTMVKNNPRIVLPEASPRREEAELMSRANMVEKLDKTAQ